MFPSLPRHDPGPDAIEKLATTMLRAPDEPAPNLHIPSGYTYFAQFVDHDITFDPTSQLQRDNDPNALVDFRTPRFDLDSLYGSGPADQPFLYDWSSGSDPGVKLLVGRNPPRKGLAARDLPRNQQGRALIGDARNDENLIVSQLHLLFIGFHNRVVDHVRRSRRPRPRGAQLLEEAQRIVRWHYQWIVTHDFLRRIVGDEMADNVFAPGVGSAAPTVERRFYTWPHEPFMPVEFSGAAYRFGHSIVREDYILNEAYGVLIGVPILRPPGERGAHLGGFRRLPASLTIEWKRFFKTTSTPPEMRSMLIDTNLAKALSRLPPDGAALTRLNLQRGRALGLPAGRDVAHAMGEVPLTTKELGLEPLPQGIDDETRQALLRATPLWYYVLCEAKARADGVHLGPVGGRIVAEVLVGLLEGDPNSYLRQWPTWKPELRRADHDTFTMADVVRFTEHGG
jgi:hypothetical protein